MNTSVVTSLIAAGSATGGVVLKILYDGIIERVRSRNEKLDRFIEDRKAAYDQFLELSREQARYRERLQEVSLIARAGKKVKPEILADFPESPMRRLVDALEEIRRIARTREIVEIAERVVALHGDASAALRHFVVNESLMYGLPLFLANRLGEDQMREFIAAYRKDLGIGPPKGTPSNFPIVDRGFPMSMAEAEQVLRQHLQMTADFDDGSGGWPESDVGKPLTSEDVKLLETPKYRQMITEGDSDSSPS